MEFHSDANVTAGGIRAVFVSAEGINIRVENYTERQKKYIHQIQHFVKKANRMHLFNCFDTCQ